MSRFIILGMEMGERNTTTGRSRPTRTRVNIDQIAYYLPVHVNHCKHGAGYRSQVVMNVGEMHFYAVEETELIDGLIEKALGIDGIGYRSPPESTSEWGTSVSLPGYGG